jgi:hypothetical protein
MNKNILPVQYPIITSFPWHANLFSVLNTDHRALPWIFSNYILTSCRQDITEEDGFLFLDFIPSGQYAIIDCPLVSVRIFDREPISSSIKQLKEFFFDLIDKKRYICTIVDEHEFIPTEKKYFPHELFIYGYDKKENIFNVADFLFKKRYSFETVDADKVCNGFFNLKNEDDYLLSYRGGILTFSRNESFIYGFDYKLVISYFYNYINSEYYCDMMSVRKDQKIKKAFGINVYDMIINSIELLGNNTCDVRTLHNLYDHKVLMVKRIKYMIENDILSINKDAFDEFAYIENITGRICFHGLKMAISKRGNDEDIQYIINKLLSIKKLEQDLYQYVIDNMSASENYKTYNVNN